MHNSARTSARRTRGSSPPLSRVVMCEQRGRYRRLSQADRAVVRFQRSGADAPSTLGPPGAIPRSTRYSGEVLFA